ncbi:MAG: TSUP family transporter, partial [Rhodobacteraceae bacterium]|nr:TSUP family transporter [Paracoccaceae bacterium]
MGDFFIFAVVGFFAQVVDGALGMGFGVISSALLLSQGVPPALVSASVNAAKLPTSGTSATSHWLHRNVVPEVVWPVLIFGALGGLLGAVLLTSLKGKGLQILTIAYLLLIGGLVIWRAIKG